LSAGISSASHGGGGPDRGVTGCVVQVGRVTGCSIPVEKSKRIWFQVIGEGRPLFNRAKSKAALHGADDDRKQRFLLSVFCHLSAVN
jgi:hypothetical protein